jgi:hypothetical protein
LGAAGGILGGAVIGVGFAAAQAGLEAIGNILKDIFDPANKAREALAGVVEQVNKLAAEEGISDLEAATRVLKEYGGAAESLDPAILAAAVATQKLVEETAELKDIVEVLRHGENLRNETIREYIKLAVEASGLPIGRPGGTPGFIRIEQAIQTGDTTRLDAAELEVYNRVVKDLALSSDDAAREQRELALAEDLAAAAASRATFAQDALANAIRRISGLRITGLEDQLAALSDTGVSARTRKIVQTIDEMAEAQARSAAASRIQQLEEQRALLLLEQRIRFQGESVRLDQLSGRTALVAIDARINALQRAGQLEQASLDAINARIRAARRADQAQDKRDREALKVFDERIEAIRKEGEAQDKVNKLLEIQFKLGQRSARQQGETIGDFLQRRAQETRALLAQQAQLKREEQIGAIEEERDAVAAIQEVANERREAAIEAMELEQERVQAAIEAAQRQRQAEIQALQDRREQIALQVEIEQNAEEIKRAEAEETARLRAKKLQEDLKASQERDRQETESRRQALEAQIKAEREKADLAVFYADKANTEILRASLLGARTYGDAIGLIGQLAGAKRALAELQAYATATGLPQEFINDFLDPLRSTISQTESKIENLIARAQGGRVLERFQSGGIIDLNNARTPFGSNIHFGEGGGELGVILGNKVSEAIKRDRRGPAGNQTFIINRSDDPYADKQRFGRKVREVMSEALG